VTISSNQYGLFNVLLPSGNATLFVRIIDNNFGVTVYYLPQIVTITLDQSAISNITKSLLSKNPLSGIINAINTGSMPQTIKFAISLGAELNKICSNSTNSALTVDQCVAARAALVSCLSDLTVSDMSSIKQVASSLSLLSNAIGQNSLSSSVEKILIQR
jgi:hypothetical protein